MVEQQIQNYWHEFTFKIFILKARSLWNHLRSWKCTACTVYVNTGWKKSQLSRHTFKNVQSIALKRRAARRIDANIVSFLSRKLLTRVQPKFKDFVALKYNMVTLCYASRLWIHHLRQKMHNYLSDTRLATVAWLYLAFMSVVFPHSGLSLSSLVYASLPFYFTSVSFFGNG